MITRANESEYEVLSNRCNGLATYVHKENDNIAEKSDRIAQTPAEKSNREFFLTQKTTPKRVKKNEKTENENAMTVKDNCVLPVELQTRFKKSKTSSI